jgi:transcriptional regulator with XRE-family HTH domain
MADPPVQLDLISQIDEHSSLVCTSGVLISVGEREMPKATTKSSTKIDKLVGTNIRVHRLAAGLTQEELGDKLGVTFQQVQKYEKGINRVGSGRLYRIAEILEVPVQSLFGDEDGQKSAHDSSPFDLLADAMTMQMAREFGKVADTKIRRAVLAVVEILAGKA